MHELKAITSTITRNRPVLFVCMVGVILVDSLFVQVSRDVVTFGVLAAYLAYARMFRTNSALTFRMSLGLFVAMAVSFLVSQASPVTEKFAVWLYLFLLIGCIQAWRE